MIVFDVPLWHLFNLLAGVVFPLLVGLVTTRATDPGLKAIYLAALSVVTNLATEVGNALQNDQPYNLGLALLAGLTTFVIAVSTHYGLWKPTGVTAKVLNSGVTSSADRVPGPDHLEGR